MCCTRVKRIDLSSLNFPERQRAFHYHQPDAREHSTHVATIVPPLQKISTELLMWSSAWLEQAVVHFYDIFAVYQLVCSDKFDQCGVWGTLLSFRKPATLIYM